MESKIWICANQYANDLSLKERNMAYYCECALDIQNMHNKQYFIIYLACNSNVVSSGDFSWKISILFTNNFTKPEFYK